MEGIAVHTLGDRGRSSPAFFAREMSLCHQYTGHFPQREGFHHERRAGIVNKTYFGDQPQDAFQQATDAPYFQIGSGPLPMSFSWHGGQRPIRKSSGNRGPIWNWKSQRQGHSRGFNNVVTGGVSSF